MALVAMNWKQGKPPEDFVGFAIEYKEPGGDKFFPLKNRLCFPRRRGRGQPEPPVDQALADPEIPLGAFSRAMPSSPAISSTGSPRSS